MENTRQRTHLYQDPMATAQHGAGLTGLQFLQDLLSGKVPAPPISSTLGFGLSEVEEGRAVFTCTPQEFHYNPIGSVHGGLAATLLDSAMACAIHSLLPAGKGYTTLELKVNFVRGISAKTGPLRAEGKIIHQGGTVMTSEGRITDAAGKLYAHGTTTCLVITR